MMNIKYRQLKAFSLAARYGSFGHAAEALAITQPSFSVLIKELEHDLGTQLFQRTTRSCQMTAAGASLYQEIDTVLHNLEEVYQHAREISAGRRGKLSLAAVPSLAMGVVAKALGDYHRLYPGVRIHMREDLNAGIVNAVKQNEVELGIACQIHEDPDVSFESLFKDQLVVVAPEDHAVMKEPLLWQSVIPYPIILMAFGSAERALQLNHIDVTPAFEVSSMGTAVAMVRHGMGIAVIPNSALDGIDMQGLRYRPLPGDLSWRHLGVLRRSGKKLSTAALAFIEVLRANAPASETAVEIH